MEIYSVVNLTKGVTERRDVQRFEGVETMAKNCEKHKTPDEANSAFHRWCMERFYGNCSKCELRNETSCRTAWMMKDDETEEKKGDSQ